jgi:hypothetical protein
MGGQQYEIIVEGVAGPAVQSAFGDCRVDVRCAATRLRPHGTDQAAFYAVLDRVRDLGLTVLEVRQLAAQEQDDENSRPN